MKIVRVDTDVDDITYGVVEPEGIRIYRGTLSDAEIARLAGKVRGTGRTLVPLRLYFKRGYAKVELALVQGKRQYDKREAIKKREAEREMRRAAKRRPDR